MEQTDETFFPIPKAISADNSAFISNFPRSIDRLTLAAHSHVFPRSVTNNKRVFRFFPFQPRERGKERDLSVRFFERSPQIASQDPRSNGETSFRSQWQAAPPEIEYMNAKFQRRSGPPRIRLSNPVENSDSLGAASTEKHGRTNFNQNPTTTMTTTSRGEMRVCSRAHVKNRLDYVSRVNLQSCAHASRARCGEIKRSIRRSFSAAKNQNN